MKFSIKNRVEILISKDRIPAAIGKLKAFTKNKNEHNEVYVELCELEGQYAKNKKLWSAKSIEYVVYNREESRIRARILDINSEIDALKETRDKKALWNIFWLVLTGILIPVLLVFLPRILDRKEYCPDFDNKPCKFLIFDFDQPSDVTKVAHGINSILQEDIEYSSILTSREYDKEGPFAPDEIIDEMELCDADFALSGFTYKDPLTNLVTVQIIPYPRDSQLADYVNVKNDTIKLDNIQGLLDKEEYKIMLKLLVCAKCGCNLPEKEILELAQMAPENKRENLYFILGSYQHKKGDLIGAERTFSEMISSFFGSIKKYAMRGKVRDDLKKYEPAFEDYSMYLEEVPDNHTVRMLRFNSVHNLLTTSGWQPRYAGYVDVAENDLVLMRNHISADQYAVAARRLQEIKDLRDKNIKSPDDNLDILPCTLNIRVMNNDGSPVSNAMISIAGMSPKRTSNNGLFRYETDNCDDILAKNLVISKDGFKEFQRVIQNNNLDSEIILQEIPVERCSFTGVVLHKENEPLSESTIDVLDFKSKHVDGEGRFAFSDVKCNEIIGKEFIIKAPGYLPYVGIVRKNKLDISIRLNPIVTNEEKCSFSGYVLTSDEKGINNATVTFNNNFRIKTGADGSFETEKIICSEWAGIQYTVTAQGYEPIRNTIKPGNFKITHRLKESSRSVVISGSVIHNPFNLPIAGVSLFIDNQEITKTNKKGQFSVERVVRNDQPDMASITFSRRGYHRKTININLTSAENLRAIMTPLNFSGQVVDDKNKPIERAEVSISGLQSTPTNANGQYSFDIKDEFSFPNSIKVAREGYHDAKVAINKGSVIQMTPKFIVNLIPLTFQNLHVIVQKEEYNEQQRKWVYVPAVGAKVFIDKKEVGTIPKDGMLKVNLTGRLNQTVLLNVKNVNQQSPPGLPMNVRFTKNGQEVVLKYYIIK